MFAPRPTTLRQMAKARGPNQYLLEQYLRCTVALIEELGRWLR